MAACKRCKKAHVTRWGGPACTGHISSGERKGQPCRKAPIDGATVCRSHGGASPQAKAAAAQRKAEAKARLKLGDAGEAVTDPIGKLMGIAGRAVAFMEQLGARVDQLTFATGDDRAEARADIVVYGRSIKDAGSLVESIIRMGIAERLAKAESDKAAAWIEFIDGVLADLGHNPRDPEVSGAVVRRLELVQGVAS